MTEGYEGTLSYWTMYFRYLASNHYQERRWRHVTRCKAMVTFTFNGIDYRTDGTIVEGHDGKKWNRTYSLSVIIAARKAYETSVFADNYKAAYCHNCKARIRDFSTYDEYGEVFCTSCGEPLAMSKDDWLAMTER